jgi:hypothetical protein
MLRRHTGVGSPHTNYTILLVPLTTPPQTGRIDRHCIIYTHSTDELLNFTPDQRASSGFNKLLLLSISQHPHCHAHVIALITRKFLTNFSCIALFLTDSFLTTRLAGSLLGCHHRKIGCCSSPAQQNTDAVGIERRTRRKRNAFNGPLRPFPTLSRLILNPIGMVLYLYCSSIFHEWHIVF